MATATGHTLNMQPSVTTLYPTSRPKLKIREVYEWIDGNVARFSWFGLDSDACDGQSLPKLGRAKFLVNTEGNRDGWSLSLAPSVTPLGIVSTEGFQIKSNQSLLFISTQSIKIELFL